MKKIFTIVSYFIAGVILFFYLVASVGDFNGKDFGLGLNTSSIINYNQGKPINGIAGDSAFFQIPTEISSTDNNKIALWLGASQIHSINEWEQGQRLAVAVANRCSKKHQISHFQLSTPNASFSDLLMLLWFALENGAKPDIVVLPFVYDDLREFPPQQWLFELMTENIIENNQTAFTSMFKLKSKEELAKLKPQLNSVESDSTADQVLERIIIDNLNTIPHFKKRKAVRSFFTANFQLVNEKFFGNVYGMLFGGEGTQRYPEVKKEQKEINIKSFLKILDVLKEREIKLLIYRQPIRPTNDIFYHEQPAYNLLFNDLIQAAKNANTSFSSADFQNIVPQQYWGMTNIGEPDIFHFKQQGHEILGKKVAEEVQHILKNVKQ